MYPEARTALHECLGAGVLIAEGDLVGFRHELARRATVAQIPDFDRIDLHRRALAVLAEPPTDPNTLAALAFHADEAGENEAAVRYGIAAAERAASLGANREAASLYALALRHADTDARRRPGRLAGATRLRVLSERAGRPGGRVVTRGDLPCGASWVIDLEEGDDLRWLSRLLQPLGRAAEAIDAAHASLRLLEDLGPSPQLAWSLINMAHISALALDPVCADYAARAHALGRRIGAIPAVDIRARGYTALTAVFSTGTGWDELESVWREALSTPGLEEHAGVLGVLIYWYAVLRCELARAERYLAEALRFCDDRDLGMFSSLLTAAATLAALHRGDWDRAAVIAEQIITRPELSPQHRILPLVTLTLLRARRGQPPAGSDRRMRLSTAPNPATWSTWARCGRRAPRWPGWPAMTSGPWPKRRPGWRAPANTPTRGRWANCAAGFAWPAAQLRPPTATPLTPFDLEVNGQWQCATEAWTARGCSYEAALAQLGGDAPAVNSALATFRRLGAKAAARRAQQRLAALRERAPRTRQADRDSDPHALTGRQRQVFDLLAAGLSNPEIAAELHISPKTVGHHVEAILAKLGVQNRTHAVAYALQHQAALRAES